MLRIIDKLLIRNFIPPYVLAFGIALFVLVMQTLWVYIDDIVGKGVGFFMIIELVAYLSVSLVPMALPIAVLIASVMVVGNLAEKYELSSLKSAGVPLIRVIRALMWLTILLSMLSYIVSNNLIPVANLKFRSRLYDIKKQKPTLSLDKGIFNYDFKGYAIRIGEKDPDNKTIYDVLIYDHSRAGEGIVDMTTARKGEMFVSEDDRFFVMELYDGKQYQEMKPNSKKKNKPYLRTTFKTFTKAFDLNEFELSRTDPSRFRSQKFLSSRQLYQTIDSFNREIVVLELAPLKAVKAVMIEDEREEKEVEENKKLKSPKKEHAPPQEINLKNDKSNDDIISQKMNEEIRNRVNKPTSVSLRIPSQVSEYDLDTVQSILQLFDAKERDKISKRAYNYAKGISDRIDRSESRIENLHDKKRKHQFELHSKFSWAVVCFIFLFIGAPMGAIVRKGGFGYPLLISIVFFMIYIVLTILFRELSDAKSMNPILAAWLADIIIFPVGLLLTFAAMNDSKLLDFKTILGNISRKINSVQ